MKRILFTGAYSTGKTSLIQLLKNRLEGDGKRVLVHSEVARECPFDLNLKQDLISSSWLVMRQLENELMDYSEYDYFIFDRGLPDIIAHTEFVTSQSDSEIDFLSQLKKLGRVTCLKYDYIFYCRISDLFEISQDGMRVNDKEFQQRLQNLQLDYLESMNIEYITLPDSNDERIGFVHSLLEGSP